MAVLFAFLCAVSLASLRLPPLLSAGLWLVTGLALLPGWVSLWQDPATEWSAGILWAKIWSMVMMCAWLSFCRAFPLKFSPRAAGTSLWLLLVLHIVEAVAWDVQKGNGINAAAGTLLCVVILPKARGRAEPTTRQGFHLLEYNLPLAWVVSYTVWNSSFTCVSYGRVAFWLCYCLSHSDTCLMTPVMFIPLQHEFIRTRAGMGAESSSHRWLLACALANDYILQGPCTAMCNTETPMPSFLHLLTGVVTSSRH